MIEAFFPVNLAQAESHWLGQFLLQQVFFPPYIAELCPEVVVVTSNGLTVRQPVLAVSALLGVVIGFKGGYDFWRMTIEKKPPPKVQQQQQQQPMLDDGSMAVPSTRLWALAFVAFGIMNVSALPLHCFLSAPMTTYPKEVSDMPRGKWFNAIFCLVMFLT
jgi:hypothetical protein